MSFLRPKINFQIIITAIIVFVLMDLWLVPYIVSNQIAVSAEYRTPIHFKYGDIKVFIDEINGDPNPKIIFTGDSVIQGGGVGSGKETISYYLQSELKKQGSVYKVYNLGVSGAAPADIYFLVKALKLTNRDLVIYDLNIGHYNNKPIVFPSITPKLSATYHNGEPLDQILKLNNKDKLEDRFQLWISNSWKLYAYREIIKEVLFGKITQNDKIKLDPWYTTDWTEQIKDKNKRGDFELLLNDLNLLFTRYLIETVKQKSATILIFNAPLNQEMMAKYDMIDRFHYDRNIKELSKVVQVEGSIFKDYEKAIPSPFFTDSIHPTKEGNQILALMFLEDITRLMAVERGIK